MPRHFTRFVVLLLTVAAACTDIPVAPPISEETNVRRFFWPLRTSEEVLEYALADSTGVDVLHTLHIPANTADVFEVLDEVNGQTSRFTALVTDSSVMLSDLSQNSIIPLPPGTFFAGDVREVKRFTPVTLFVPLGESILAPDSSGTFYVSKDRGASWEKASNGGAIGTVKAIVVDSATPPSLYAVVNDVVYRSEDEARSWKLIDACISGKLRSAPVTSLAVDAQGALWFGTSKGVFRSETAGATATSTSVTSAVYSIAATTGVQSKKRRIIAATADGMQFEEGSGVWTRSVSYTAPPAGSVIAAGSLVFAIEGSMVYYSTDGGLSWNAAGSPSTPSVQIVAAQWDASNETLIVADEGRTLYRFDMKLSKWLPSPVVVENHILDILPLDNARLLIATSTGVIAAGDLGVTNEVGPFANVNVETKGGLTLLNTATGPLKVGAQWPAGRLSIQNLPTPLPITATVLDRVDAFEVAHSGRHYGETYAVRYSYNDATGNAASGLPYWIIYFARDVGPVLINEVSGTGAERQVSRAARLK